MVDNAQNSQTTVKVVYMILLVNILVQFLGIIGVIIAYVHKNDAPSWLQTHYQFQIRTFWIGLLLLVSGGLLWVAGIGAFILLFWLVWLIVRCVKGMMYLDKNQPHPNPTTWLFS
ncbi:DUF4870 family protein [Methylophaga sp.]|uniref:DUF4870 family protein n=1 Tax=Methylophaga sp. TaxID=2024840 RepID=UPI003F699305